MSGMLRYKAPGTLEKHVLSPFDELIIIDNNQITIERQEGDSVQRIIHVIPAAVRALVDSIRATLAGDHIRLQQHYDVRVISIGI